MLECEVDRNETITLVLARGSYHPDKAEKPAAAAPKAAAAPVQEPPSPVEFNLSNSIKRRGSATRRMSMSRNSTELNVALSQQGDRSPKSPRRGSIARRTSGTTGLPPLPVLDAREDAEAAAEELAKAAAAAPLSTLVPDLLISPQKAMVRGWHCEDDHFEVRVWTSSPLKRSPELLTEPKPVVVQEQTHWMQHLELLKQSFDRLEEAHEESVWQMRLGVCRLDFWVGMVVDW